MDRSNPQDDEDLILLSHRNLLRRIQVQTEAGSIITWTLFEELHGPPTGEIIIEVVVICPHGVLLMTQDYVVV